MWNNLRYCERNLAAVLFTLLFIILVVQIFSRYMFNISVVWTEELSRWLYIYVVMLGSCEAITKREHIAVDLLPNLLKGKWKAGLFIAIHLVYLLTCLYFIKLGYKSTLRMDRLQAITMDVPVSFLYIIVPVGFALMALRSAINIIIDFKTLIGFKAVSYQSTKQ